MASGPDFKSQVIAQELANKLTRLVPTLTPTVGSDSDGWPTIVVGDGVAGHQNAFVKIFTQVPSQLKDSLGLQQTALGPHVAQVALETSTIANVSLLTAANTLLILGEVVSFLNKTELYLSANATAPTAAAITGAPAAVFLTADNWAVQGDM